MIVTPKGLTLSDMPHRLHIGREAETPGVNACHSCVVCVVCEEWFDMISSSAKCSVKDEQDDPCKKEQPSDLRSHNGYADKPHRSGDESNDQEQQGALAASFTRSSV